MVIKRNVPYARVCDKCCFFFSEVYINRFLWTVAAEDSSQINEYNVHTRTGHMALSNRRLVPFEFRL